LIREKRKRKRIRLGIVKRDKTVLRVQNLFQRFVDAGEQLVQVCRFVEGMHNFGDDLALGFHALQIGHVPAAENDPLNDGIACVICR
jgi:hypothetical protein